MIVSIIVAMDRNGGIGWKNRLPWHLPDDLRRFRQLTMGHHLILGRRTYESIGRPLVGRKIIVISRRRSAAAGDVVKVVPSLELALEVCRQAQENEAFIGGGATVFREALPLVQKIYLTRVLAEFEADAFFPPWDEREWEVVSRLYHPPDQKHAFPFQFIEYARCRDS
ncbi:MAG: dihydrofolate reductase [Anaerolineales bacterium]|nr:dihydrofolate reductase [Anaerolineales bacterium]MDW8160616.1 dihydrofolate reductase [Anaerolineales bacterium]